MERVGFETSSALEREVSGAVSLAQSGGDGVDRACGRDDDDDQSGEEELEGDHGRVPFVGTRLRLRWRDGGCEGRSD